MGHLRTLAAPSIAATLTVLTACSAAPVEPAGVEHLTAEIQERLPFDKTSFTQGLEATPDGNLYVGTGQEGESRIYIRTPGGEEVVSQPLELRFFGEGISLYDDHLWQLTWLDGTALKRDPGTLEETGRATYEGEGWGICARPDANEVIFSDGTSQLRRMDPDTFEERERFEVTMNGEPVEGLNELECVGGDVYANIFTTTDIVRIDAATGEVTALIDASGLPNNADADPNHVLNGIAHIPGTDEFYLAGKRWPDLYRVKFTG